MKSGNLEKMHSAAKGYAAGGHVTALRPAANSNRMRPIPLAITTRSTVDKDGNIKTFVENVSQGVAQKEVATASPKIVNAANQRVVPTMAAYQNNTAGGDYRNG
jgi:hypothetical protein